MQPEKVNVNITLSLILMGGFHSSTGQFSSVEQRYQNGENLTAAALKNRAFKYLARKKIPRKHRSFKVFMH